MLVRTLTRRSDCRWAALFALPLLLGTISCARVTSNPGGGTGAHGDGSGASNVRGTGGSTTPGRDASLPGTDGPTATGDANICQQAEYKFEPKIPTVYLVVDRSGSMFTCLNSTDQTSPCADQNNSAWSRLKASILNVVMPLQGQVRFGFVAFNGTAGGACPDVKRVPAALNNYGAIATLYNSLPFRQPTDKWETPARRTLEMVGADLKADTTPGDKYILFVTDGEPDYCGDGNQLCAPESVVGYLQTLKASSITTIVFGLQSAMAGLAPGILQSYANAGAGEPTLPPLRAAGKLEDFYDQCFNGGDTEAKGWRADFIATGKPQVRGPEATIGTYSTTMGPTKPYTPDPSNQQQLVEQLSRALSGVKGCTFDLGNINGKAIKVDLARLDKASVSVGPPDANGKCDPSSLKPIPLDQTNGWRMANDRQLDLVGSGCTDWRKPENTCIHFGFPCDIIIVE